MDMRSEIKSKRLSVFLRIWGAAAILVMCINWSAFIFKLASFNPPNGTFFWLIWDDVYGHVGPMIFVIYIVWGIYMFPVAKNPDGHISFLKFTMWANLAHGLVMVPMALSDKLYHLRMLTDIPFILAISLAIYLWLPNEKPKNIQLV